MRIHNGSLTVWPNQNAMPEGIQTTTIKIAVGTER